MLLLDLHSLRLTRVGEQSEEMLTLELQCRHQTTRYEHESIY